VVEHDGHITRLRHNHWLHWSRRRRSQ
jgi:hypothetical protein